MDDNQLKRQKTSLIFSGLNNYCAKYHLVTIYRFVGAVLDGLDSFYFRQSIISVTYIQYCIAGAIERSEPSC